MFWNKKKKSKNETPHQEAEPFICLEKKEINDKIPAEVVEKVEKETKELMESMFQERGFGYTRGDCHRAWHIQKELFKKYGYEWYSPSEVNPLTLYD